MDKPKPVERTPILKYNDCIYYIENKYNINTSDYYDSNSSYEKFRDQVCQELNANPEDLKNDIRNMKTTNPEEYKRICEVRAKVWARIEELRPPYCNFWQHFCDDNAGNGYEFYMGLEPKEDCPDWVKEILKLIKDEFGEYSDGEGIKFLIEW